MFEYKITPMDVYGETEEYLQRYLKSGQRFVAFREPRPGEKVLVIPFRVSTWYASTEDRIRFIIESVQPEVWELTQVIPTPKTVDIGDYWSQEDGNIIRAIRCFNVQPSEKVFKLTKKGGTTV